MVSGKGRGRGRGRGRGGVRRRGAPLRRVASHAAADVAAARLLRVGGGVRIRVRVRVRVRDRVGVRARVRARVRVRVRACAAASPAPSRHAQREPASRLTRGAFCSSCANPFLCRENQSSRRRP